MSWETASAIAEVIAAIAVVVSLWYLAIQLKQSTELAKADLEVQLGVTWAEMHDNMILNPGLARAYDLAAKNWSDISEEDARAYLWFIAKSFHILEGMYRQFRRGLLAEDVGKPYDQYIYGVLQIDAVRGWWESDGSLTSKAFKHHVENLLLATSEQQWRQVSTSEMVPGDS